MFSAPSPVVLRAPNRLSSQARSETESKAWLDLTGCLLGLIEQTGEEISCSRFSVLGSRFSVLGSRFSVLGSRFSAWATFRTAQPRTTRHEPEKKPGLRQASFFAVRL
jgi:hypothetical protein